MLYFAYGSNMSTRRLLARLPDAITLGVARLSQHKLCFHKKNRHDGSAKCNALATDNPVDVIYGVVFDIDAQQLAALDQFEGLGKGYARKQVSIRLTHGATVDACTYYATDIDDDLLPLHWYRTHVLQGAREHGLPAAYIREIEAVISIADPDHSRHVREMAIYDLNT